ncbi:MAG: biopolymer transporter ExbD [Deltaproteobacteria bacterium]|nr:biopolymer transporter ExbD [Deltaproteobacteria bacterium]
MNSGGKIFSRFQAAREVADVNLIPVMNLFVTLIPFLLLAAAFYHVSVIPTSLPSQTDGVSDTASDDVSVTVNLLVEKEKIRLTASSATLDEETLSELTLEIFKKKDGFDYDLLTSALVEIKRRYSKSDTVIVLPADDIPYKDIVQILDTSRERRTKVKNKEKSEPLFPVVVLSKKV